MASYFKPTQNKNANVQLGSTPGVGSAGTSGNIKTGGNTPGNYVNFENYLKGNKDQAEGLAGNVASSMSKEADEGYKKLEDYSNKYNQEMYSGYDPNKEQVSFENKPNVSGGEINTQQYNATPNLGTGGTSQTKYLTGLSNPNDLEYMSKVLNQGQYGMNEDVVKSNLSNQNKNIELANRDLGQQLQNQYGQGGQYSRGMNVLDRSLVQGTEKGAKDIESQRQNIKDTQTKKEADVFGGLKNYLSGTNAKLAEQQNKIKSTVEGQKSAAEKALIDRMNTEKSKGAENFKAKQQEILNGLRSIDPNFNVNDMGQFMSDNPYSTNFQDYGDANNNALLQNYDKLMGTQNYGGVQNYGGHNFNMDFNPLANSIQDLSMVNFGDMDTPMNDIYKGSSSMSAAQEKRAVEKENQRRTERNAINDRLRNYLRGVK